MAVFPAEFPFPLGGEPALPASTTLTRGPNVRYPAGQVTPHGAYYVLSGKIPIVRLRSYDDTVLFDLMGGTAIPDRTMPERVELLDLKGLIPPWETVDQKGATQDGVTFIDALYGPIEVEMKVKIKGRNPQYTRKVFNHLVASIDAKQTSELSWFTHQMGRWWAPVRWFKTPVDPISRVASNKQELSLRLRADSGFWQSYPDTSQFRFSYIDDIDEFNFIDSDDLGTNWTLAYTGAGSSHISVANGMAKWVESGTTVRRVVARRNSFATTTNNQVSEVVLGTLPEWHFVNTAYNDLWCRMNTTGTPGTSGIRVRFGWGALKLSYFTGGVETVLRERPLLIPPLPGERWSLVCGFEGNERMFKVMRSGIPIMVVKESGTASPLGASNRGAGFGMEAGSGIFQQASPAAVRVWNAGDNSTVSQEGFLELTNVGDQPLFYNYTCFGPGMFNISDGPDNANFVQFGPLLTNQVMQIRTDPRKRGVIDMTSTPPTPQELNFFQQALKDLIDFASAGNVPPLLQELESIFGINPPQGNPYSLLTGRFKNAIPQKSPGNPAQAYNISVSIDDGNADSRIVASGTPLRRMPY